MLRRPAPHRSTTTMRRSTTTMRLAASVGVLCVLWLGQARLQAQFQQMPNPQGFPPAGAPPQLNTLTASANALPGGNGANGSNMVNGANAPAAAAPAQASGDAPRIPITNVFAAIRQGGVMMIPIIGCSFGLMVFVFERLLFLRRARVIPRSFVRGVIEQLEQQQLERDEAIALCEENGSPTAELFQAALKRYGRPAVEIEQSVLDNGERVCNSLRSYLRLFSAISNITPLLGLLGTVLGMIEAFNSIAQTGAMGRPELLAGGIGQALLTTAAGLFVAIPAYIAYAYFVGRADKLIIEMDSQVQRVIELISAEGLQEAGKSRRSRRAA